MNIQNLFAFSLGREWKLSLAELMAIFWEENYREHSEVIAIFEIRGWSDEQLAKRFLTIGGSIRVMKVIGDTDEKRFPTDVIHHIQDARSRVSDSGKITFALGSYGLEFRLSDIGLRIKKTLQESWISSRLVNTENHNIVSAVWKRDKLGRSRSEYSLIHIEGVFSIAVTLACQDIDDYTRRDTGKCRDMVVGMMPPKLVQMMLNLALSNRSDQWSVISDQIQKTNHLHSDNCELHTPHSLSRSGIYDPFCGLGTTLIEAANMGITRIYGSDLSSEMVRVSRESLEAFIQEELIWQGRIRAVWGTPAKDFSDFQSEIFELDARKIEAWLQRISQHSQALILQDSQIPTRQPTLHIVSEGYLGEMMNPRDISLDRVQSERRKLAAMYSDFFAGLAHADFRGSIVMSFPFWNIHGVYSYFTEIYDVIEKRGFEVISLLPESMHLNTRKWSLLYRRENQTVGREIVKIEKKLS